MEISRIGRNGESPAPLETAPESPVRASCVPVPTALYRHFDKDGDLLYVGISLSPLARTKKHKEVAGWYREVATITIEWLPSKMEALEAETQAIRREKPKHNIHGWGVLPWEQPRDWRPPDDLLAAFRKRPGEAPGWLRPYLD